MANCRAIFPGSPLRLVPRIIRLLVFLGRPPRCLAGAGAVVGTTSAITALSHDSAGLARGSGALCGLGFRLAARFAVFLVAFGRRSPMLPGIVTFPMIVSATTWAAWPRWTNRSSRCATHWQLGPWARVTCSFLGSSRNLALMSGSQRSQGLGLRALGFPSRNSPRSMAYCTDSFHNEVVLA